MALIKFKNKPDTTTPVTAENLNNNFDSLFPVGSVYTTYTNTNPAAQLDGTWALINKEFSPYSIGYGSEASTDYFTANENVSAVNFAYTRNGSSIQIRLLVDLAASVGETNTELGTFNFENLGIAKFPLTRYGMVAGSDTQNAYVVYQVSQEGVLSILDVITKDGSNTIASGGTIYFDFVSVFNQSNMLDSACNRFCWRRTA